MSAPTPPDPPAPPPAPARLPRHQPHALAPGQLLLVYTPDGPVGGTFTCTVCAAQAWQPDLLDHAPACPQRQPNTR